jgi:hypothetical protein
VEDRYKRRTSKSEIPVFLSAVWDVLTDPNWELRLQKCPLNEWVSGALYQQWLLVGQAAMPDPLPGFPLGRYVSAELQQHIDGLQNRVLEEWCIRAKIVTDNGAPIAPIVSILREEFLSRSQNSGAPTNSSPTTAIWGRARTSSKLYDLIPTSLDFRPGETKVQWNARIRMAAETEVRWRKHARDSLLRPRRQPQAQRSVSYNHRALVLALSGLSWREIFNHYKDLSSWKSPNSALRGAQEIAKKLSLQWPLRLPRSGRPRKK